MSQGSRAMTDFQINCVHILDFFKEGITYNEWKKQVKRMWVDEYKFDEMILYLLTRGVIDCKNGLFYWNGKYNTDYIIRYDRRPNFCLEHIQFFDNWVNLD